MAAESGTGRRLLAISAVLCAVFGLVLAASGMPILASESPATDVFDDERDQESERALSAADQPDGAGSLGGDGGGDRGGDGLSVGGPGGALAERAGDIDNPLLEGALYGLAALFVAFGGDPSLAQADANPEANGALAEAGIGGEFGDVFDSSADSGEFVDGDADGDEEGAQTADSDEGTDASSDDLENGGEFDSGGAGSGDGDGGTDDGTAGDGDGSSGDGDGTTADGDGSSGTEDGTTGDGTSDEGDSSETTTSGDSDGEERSTSDGDTDGTGSEWENTDGETNGENSAPDDGYDDSDGSTADTADGGADTDGESAGTDDGDDANAADEDGDGDDSGLEDAVPGLSDGVVTAALAAIGLLVLGYVFYTRENPIGTLLSIPGRLVSVALTIVVACSRACERAIASIRGLRSIADLPGLVLATIRDAFRSAGTRVRNARSSLFGGRDEDGTDEIGETHVTARERIRQAFESVVDASPMYRGRVATATPTEVARSARDAGAPGEAVQTITDSFRDVEYGDRDPDPYLEPTTSAHDRLRSALEATEDEAGENGTGERDPTEADSAE